MFETLVASTPVGRRSPLQMVASIATHAVLSLGAMLATRGAAMAGPNPALEADPAALFLNRPTPPTPATSSRGNVATTDDPILPTRIDVVLPGIVVGIPTPDLSAPFDPSAFAGEPLRGNLPLVGGESGPGGIATLPANDEVDEPARRIHVVRPVYPPVLRAAGLEGTVRVSFVIDTAGRVEEGSVTVLASTHDGFRSSALDAVAAQRFTPARRRGVVVRTLAELTVRFSMPDDR